MNKATLKKRIDVSSGKEPADLVIKNGRVIDVFNGEVIESDIAISDGFIVGLGKYKGKEIMDAKGSIISPTLIDGHVHIESSMITPMEMAKVLLLHGVTTVIADPHEIANVLGIKGIEFMIESSKNLPVDFYFMLPSSVPATDFEESGARLEANDLKPLFSNPKVLGLAEVMNYPDVFEAKDSMLDKILESLNHHKKIDGHAAGLNATNLNIYKAAEITTDHEATSIQEAKERLQRGMYLMIREGTAAKDLKALIKVVNDYNARRCLFVTDDKHLDDLMDEGSIDYNLRLTITEGIPPITAIQMGTINAAECFNLKHLGAIAPGYQADLMFLEDMKNITITQVFKRGKQVVKDGKLVNFPETSALIKEKIKVTTCFQNINKEDLKIPLKGKKANVIGIIPNSLITDHLIEEVETNNGVFVPSNERDLLKMAVINRHYGKKQIGLGIVKGLGIKEGAIASTVAHDSHNLIVTGTSDHDMLFAVKMIKEMAGGLVVVKENSVVALLRLPIAGLMSVESYKTVYDALNELKTGLVKIGANTNFNPFLTLSFLSLPVIPKLKLTDKGLFRVSDFQHISIDG